MPDFIANYDADEDQACIEIYEASKSAGFKRAIALVAQVALDSKAPRPTRGEDLVNWETHVIVRDAIEEALSNVQNAVARGEQLTQNETGEYADGQETGHNRERPRA